MDMKPNSRRDWLPVTSALEQIDAAQAGLRRSLDVVILGAGMAGLAAGYELASRGHTVTIYEGSKRVGGRVWTERWDSGAHAERGAMRIPDVHDYTAHYADVTGLLKDRLVFSNANLRYDLRGRPVQQPEINLRELTPQERDWAAYGVGRIFVEYMKPLLNQLDGDAALRRALVHGDFEHPQVKRWDAMSLEDYLNSQSPSAHALDLMARALSLGAMWHWSLAAELRDQLGQRHYDRLWAIAGGMDRLPNELARLAVDKGVKIECERKVASITLKPDGTGTVGFTSGAPRDFERCICTLPLPVMRNKWFRLIGEFSAEKRAAIEHYPYISSNKVLFHYKAPWWGLLEGRFISDQEIRGGHEDRTRPGLRQAYLPTTRRWTDDAPARASAREEDLGEFRLHIGDPPEPGEMATVASLPEALARPQVLLASYSVEAGSRSYPDSDAEAAAHLLRLLRRLVPGAPAPDAATVVHRWDANEWSRGAFAITPPRMLTLYYRTLKERSGNIYFAGEHVSIAPGWIQGALESSLREVQHLLADASAADAQEAATTPYLAVRRTGDLAVTAGVLSDDAGPITDLASGQAAAAQALHRLLDVLLLPFLRARGERVKQAIRLEGYVAAPPGFSQHGEVFDRVSAALGQRFPRGAGEHTRIAVGAPSLPRGRAVELVLWVEVEPGADVDDEGGSAP